MTQDEMNILVPRKLKEIEEQYDVVVLWAVESGSRAWGFASPDSDFDVRFIYKRKPKAYLKLNPDRDVIEIPIDETWDVCGWDLDKALKLLQKSNPTLYEWMHSPIVYYGEGFPQRTEKLLKEYFDEYKMINHYLSMCKRHIKEYLCGHSIIPKKYLYALRSILACRWIRHYHTAPPVLFETLCQAVLPQSMNNSIEYLLNLKRNTQEKAVIPPIQEVNEFLDEQILEMTCYLKTITPKKSLGWDDLNQFFLNEVF